MLFKKEFAELQTHLKNDLRLISLGAGKRRHLSQWKFSIRELIAGCALR